MNGEIILDSGGGIELYFSGSKRIDPYYHSYGHHSDLREMAAHVAEDILTWLRDPNTEDWEGNEYDEMRMLTAHDTIIQINSRLKVQGIRLRLNITSLASAQALRKALGEKNA